MSRYYLTDRNLYAYSLTANDPESLKKEIAEHQKNGWRNANACIVKSIDRKVGLKIRICHFPDINAFWPPKKDKHEPRLEVFGLSILIEPIWHDFFDTVVFDPLGEYPVGAKVDEVSPRKRNRA